MSVKAGNPRQVGSGVTPPVAQHPGLVEKVDADEDSVDEAAGES